MENATLLHSNLMTKKFDCTIGMGMQQIYVVLRKNYKIYV